jgi:hypothetical protein
MPEIVKNAVATTAGRSHVERRRGSPNSHGARRYQDLFVEGRKYVFDGNRVVAHWRVGSNGIGRWRLYTINSDLSLVITPDLRIRKYRRSGVHIIRSFKTVFDALKPLDQAISDCAINGHAWSPVQDCSDCPIAPRTWHWCLCCGAEQVLFLQTGEWLEWPDDDEEIGMSTDWLLPTLHGPIVGGAQ